MSVHRRSPTGACLKAFDVTPHRFIAGIITERGSPAAY
jgi:methylthioribose-1-phosphate isomerase